MVAGRGQRTIATRDQRGALDLALNLVLDLMHGDVLDVPAGKHSDEVGLSAGGQRCQRCGRDGKCQALLDQLVEGRAEGLFQEGRSHDVVLALMLE